MAANTVAETSSIAAAMEEVSLDDIGSRHRKERKELQAKIQMLKKNAPKSDKKKRKEVLEEIASLESSLEQRHAQELNAVNKALCEKVKPAEGEPNTPDESPSKEETQQRLSKAQKRRDKKSREAKQREEEIRAYQEENLNAPKAVELRTILDLLKERQLMLHHIPSDGDCLYNAVRYQLQQSGVGVDYSVSQLREETANYIAANKDTLICYMTNPKTGELLNDAEFEAYCENVRRTHAWGGQIELKALSSVLKMPIEVLQATGAPTLQGADEFAGPNLVITYHRHMYSLGEHYNATKPFEHVASEENFSE